jgi:hypothetical protein
MKSKTIAGASGLGDGIYLYPVVKYLKDKYSLTVATKFPEIYKPLNVKTKKYTKKVDIYCNYIERKSIQTTNQFYDICVEAGIPRDIPFEIDYKKQDINIPSGQKKIMVITRPYTPLHWKNPENRVCEPDYEKMQEFILRQKRKYYIVQLGTFSHYEPYRFHGIDLDLTGKTNYRQLMTVIDKSDAVIGQIGYVIAAAEALNKKCMIFWAKTGLLSNLAGGFYKFITPRKILTKDTSYYVVDSWDLNYIQFIFHKLETGSIQEKQEIKFSDEDKQKQASIERKTHSNLNIKLALRKRVGFKELYDYIHGKKVLILGSAPNSEKMTSRQINGHDIVVRTNNYKFFNDNYKIDIYYSYFGKNIKKQQMEIIKDKVKYIMCKYPLVNWKKHIPGKSGFWADCIYDRLPWFPVKYYIAEETHFIENFNLIDNVPTTGFSAICDIMRFEPAKLNIGGFDFFKTKVHNINEKWRGNDDAHVPDKEKKIVKKWVKEKKIHRWYK